jgi:CheY-like chemotaxis protein
LHCGTISATCGGSAAGVISQNYEFALGATEWHGCNSQIQGARTMATESTDKTASKRILIVDDDAEIVESIRMALEARGYKILVARDGNQGLAMAEREDPDLLILDMMMPKRSGFLVLEKLRRTRPVPMRVIMITANEGSRHKAYAEMLGVDDYIRKPFAMDRLMESVQKLLD